MTTIIETKDIPQVELDFMNATHFEEIAMVKSLGELVSNYQQSANDSNSNSNSNSNEKAITESLQEWLSHTTAHFERENELMQQTGFPALPVHSNEHQQALKNMQAIIEAWQHNHDIDLLADFIFDLWPNWFNTHVNTMDMMTAKFAVMNGYSE